MVEDSRPIVGITVGDETGIGPEVVAKALARGEIYELCRPLAIGSMDAMLHTINILDLQVALRRVEGPREGQFKRGTIDFLDVGELAWGSFGLGETQVEVGRAMMHYTEKAIELALSGEIDAICSAPVNKEATRLAGYDFPGQTEFLAYLTGAKKYAMMLTFGVIHVFFVLVNVTLNWCKSIGGPISAGKPSLKRIIRCPISC